jgi:hypothetical protein
MTPSVTYSLSVRAIVSNASRALGLSETVGTSLKPSVHIPVLSYELEDLSKPLDQDWIMVKPSKNRKKQKPHVFVEASNE